MTAILDTSGDAYPGDDAGLPAVAGGSGTATGFLGDINLTGLSDGSGGGRFDAKGRGSASGPLAGMESNLFGFTSLSYPQEIGSLAHCIVFNINKQDLGTSLGDIASKTGLGFDFTSGDAGENVLLDATGVLGTSGTGNRLNSSGVLPGNLGGVGTKTKRISTTIQLYVPETVEFQQNQQYETPSMSALAVAGAELLISGLTGGIVGRILGSGIGGVSKKVGGFLGAGLAASSSFISPGTIGTGVQVATGYAINPVIEVLYSSPSLRTFHFDFSFSPRNQFEADSVFQIIKQFRIHSSPELAGPGLKGAFYVPPDTFDITFMQSRGGFGGFSENNNIPGIATCVLQNLSVNYAPENQFVTFEDGFPVNVRLSMDFMELGMITQSRIKQGY